MHNIVEVNSYDANVQVCDDGDPGAAASFQPTAQSLANRTKNLNTRLTSAESTITTHTSQIAALQTDDGLRGLKAWTQMTVSGSTPTLIHSYNIDTVSLVDVSGVGTGPFYFDFHMLYTFAGTGYMSPTCNVWDGSLGISLGLIPYSTTNVHVFTWSRAGAAFNPIGGNATTYFLHVAGV